MFPLNWNKQRVMEEVAYAFKNRQPVEGSDVFFDGVSTNNIIIRMVIVNDKITTVYPI